MDKDEILARSRMENTGIDEYERAVLEKAGRFSMKAGLLACCACAAAEVALTEHISSLSWTVYFCMLASQFWYKFARLRRKHELAAALLYTAAGLFFAVRFGAELWERHHG